MKKNYFILFYLITCSFVTFAQKKSASDAYFDFKTSRNVKGDINAIQSIISLLKMSNDLSVKQITNAEYHLGRMYEEIGLADSAIVHYEKSLKGEPNYVVIHRALGFIYLYKTRPFVAQMNEASKGKDSALNAKAFAQYKVMVLKAIPYLEKYQACEPDDETLGIITNLYKSMKDEQSLASLTERLIPLAKNCVTLLEDE